MKKNSMKKFYKFTNEEVKDLLFDYNSIDNIFPKNKPERVEIWDETLRDGEQSPGVYLTKEEKIIIAKALDEVGVSLIAVGFPAVSTSEFDTVKAIVHENFKKSKIIAIARPRQSDIDACIRAGLDEIVLFMPISALMRKVLKINKEQELELIAKMINYAREHGLTVNWVSEDASRTEPDYLLQVYNTAVENGVKRIVISDTVGVLTPPNIEYITELVKNNVLNKHPNVGLGVHTHNDFGLAVANTVEAVFHGATFPHTCVNGYGERAGNAALEEVVMILERNGIDTGVELDKLYELSQLVEEKFCLPLSMHKPIVGDFSFSHESGLHVNAILSHPLTYEPINPKILGRNRKFYLGKLSGSGAIINALSEKLKLIDMNFPKEILNKIVVEVKEKQEKAPKDQIKRIFHDVKAALAKITSGVSDKEFYEIIRNVAGDELEKYLQEQNKNFLPDVDDQKEKK